MEGGWVWHWGPRQGQQESNTQVFEEEETPGTPYNPYISNTAGPG